MAPVSIYIQIGRDARVWGDRGRVHKMGWLRAGDKIHAIGSYKNWLRFDPYGGCEDLHPRTDNYPEYYCNVNEIDGTAFDPGGPSPDPNGDNGDGDPVPGDAELGMALRILGDFFVAIMRKVLQ